MPDDNFVKRAWRQLVFDAPRVVRHSQSRRRVLVVLIALLIVAVVVGSFYGSMLVFEYRFGGGWYGVGGVVFMYALAFSLRRHLKQRGNTLVLSLAQGTKPSFRTALLRQRGIQTLVLARAAFETLNLGPGVVPSAGELRARLLQRVRGEGLWDGLPAPLRDLLSSPEGSWEPTIARRGTQLAESIQFLDWATHSDRDLPKLQTAISCARETVSAVFTQLHRGNAPELDQEESYLRSELEIEAQRQPIIIYLVRIRNELIKRNVLLGEFDNRIDHEMAIYMAYAESVGEASIVAEDLPLEGGLVGEASSDDLQSLLSLTAARFLILDALLSAMRDGSTEPISRFTFKVLGELESSDGYEEAARSQTPNTEILHLPAGDSAE